MSDIQEEMKRIYKKAIKKDLERNYEQNLFVGRAIKLEEENKELQDRINKAVEYIEDFKNYREIIGTIPGEDTTFLIDIDHIRELLNILKGDNK